MKQSSNKKFEILYDGVNFTLKEVPRNRPNPFNYIGGMSDSVSQEALEHDYRKDNEAYQEHLKSLQVLECTYDLEIALAKLYNKGCKIAIEGEDFHIVNGKADTRKVVGEATIKISGEDVQVTISVNQDGNLVIDGTGSVIYEMWENVLTLTRFKG